MNDKRRRPRGKPRGPTMAEKADRHLLYQEAVQCVEAEIDFVDETFTVIRKRKAVSLREDFCGTANTSCEWVRRRRTNVAVAVDLDAEVLEWGREHNVSKLGKAASRVTLMEGDVLKVDTGPVDVILAHNFSYWLFKDRKTLKRYFARLRRTLNEDGVLFLDAYGGAEAITEMTEETEHDDFSYIWDQASFDPISGDMLCHIHFKFPDRSRLDNAFTYNWRLWTLPELQEILVEAGFSRITIYWQGEDEDGEASGEFSPVERGDADPAWIVYIVAAP